MLCIVFHIIFYWDGRLRYFFWHQPHYKAIMLLLLAYCQQYGYFVLEIEFLKALKRYSTNKYIAAWCVATLEMPSFEGAAAVGLKGRSSQKRFRQRLRKSWAAECLNYALWFQHRSDRTDVWDDEDWKLGYLTFSRSIVNEIWFCLLFILRQRKKLLIRIRQHLD